MNLLTTLKKLLLIPIVTVMISCVGVIPTQKINVRYDDINRVYSWVTNWLDENLEEPYDLSTCKKPVVFFVSQQTIYEVYYAEAENIKDVIRSHYNT